MWFYWLHRRGAWELERAATRSILEREYSEYNQAAYQRLAAISAAHRYRLRNSEGYRKRNAAPANAAHADSPLANGASRSLKACPDTCASTPCIRATYCADVIAAAA
jgi:hypothetical protein